MEEGSASLVAAHLAKAERQAGEGGFQLPQRLVCAQEARPKLIDISNPLEPIVCSISRPPTIKELKERIDDLNFRTEEVATGYWV